MSNKIKVIDIKNQTYYFFDDIINMKNFNSNNIKIDEKSYKNILIYYIGSHIQYRIKDSKYVKTNSINPLYFNFSKVNGYFEIINRKKIFDASSYKWKQRKNIEKDEELWSKSRDLITLLTKNPDDQDEKYI